MATPDRRKFIVGGVRVAVGLVGAGGLVQLNNLARAAEAVTGSMPIEYSPGPQKAIKGLPVIPRVDSEQVPKAVFTPGANSFARKTDIGSGVKVRVENLTGREGLNIKPSVLEQFQTDMNDTGLAGRITLRVVSHIDKVLCRAAPSDPMGKSCNSAVYDSNEQVIYVADSDAVVVTKDIRHEMGHALDPNFNPTLANIDTRELNDRYHERFLGYLNRLPSADSYLGDYYFSEEKNVVEGYAVRVGEQQWPVFHEAVKEIAGVKPFFVPDEVIGEAIKSLPENTLPARALSWRKERVEETRVEKKRPMINGFAAGDWGGFLMRESFGDTESKDVPVGVKQETQDAYSLARFEAYAELNVLRMGDDGAARVLWPEAVEVQKRAVASLKEKNRFVK